MKTKLFIAGLAFMALTTLASAQNKAGSAPMPKGGTEKGVNFVDANKDGICDNMGTNGSANCKGSGGNGCAMGGGQMKGMGKGMGMGKGDCKNFVDADKNGVCDNFEAAKK